MRRFQPVFLHLFGNKELAGNVHLFFFRIPWQFNNLKSIAQGRGNGMQNVRRCKKNDL